MNVSAAQAILTLLSESARDLPCAILVGVIILLLIRMFMNKPRLFRNGDNGPK